LAIVFHNQARVYQNRYFASITSNRFAITFAPADNLAMVNSSWENSPRNALLRLQD